MKANAPEKIYVSNYSSGLTYNWHDERLAVNDIKYIRADAFIEKAAKWLDDNIWAYVEIMHPTVDSYTRINRERLIWDFKKVMRR